MIVTNVEVVVGGILQVDTEFHIVGAVYDIAIDIRTDGLINIDTREILVGSHVILGDVVVENCWVAIIRVDTSITWNNAVVLERDSITPCGNANIIQTNIAAWQGTVAEGNVGIRSVSCRVGYSDISACCKASDIRCVDSIGEDLAIVERDIGTSIAPEKNTLGLRTIVALNGHVFEMEVVNMNQCDCAEKISAGILVVVDDNDLVALVTLEGDGVDFRLAHIIFGKVEVLISAGAEMESGGTIDTAVG